MIRIPPSVLDTIRREAVARYPEECCGLLLGRDAAPGAPGGGPVPLSPDPPPRAVLEARAVANRRKEERERRYLVAPSTLLDAEREAEARGLGVVGSFHSHPDHPAVPSEFDREHAWPWYSYLIVSVGEEGPGEIRSWRLAGDRTAFREEEIRADGRAPASAGSAAEEEEGR